MSPEWAIYAMNTKATMPWAEYGNYDIEVWFQEELTIVEGLLHSEEAVREQAKELMNEQKAKRD